MLGGNTAAVACYRARFAGTVMPGDTIVTSMWREADAILLEAANKEKGTPGPLQGPDRPALTMETIGFEVSEGVARLRLARPEAGNAVTGAMAREIMDAVGRCDRDPAVRAVLLTGEGRRFCVGGDLRAFTAHGTAPARPSSAR